MMRRLIRTAWGLAMLGGALGSCDSGPGHEDAEIQRLETALCDKAAACDCADPFDMERVCGQWPPEPSFFRTLHDDRAFDAACVDAWLAWVEGLACGAAVLPRYAEICPLYHGTLTAGMDCVDTDVFSSPCERGLLCIAGRCRDPQALALGGADQPCELGDVCLDEQLACIDQICRRLPTAGEPCVDRQCARDAVCIDDGCQSLPLAGEPCLNTQCHPDARCDLDGSEAVCVALSDEGEPCRGHAQCLSGNCPAGRCEAPAGPGEPCSNQLPCGKGLQCGDGRCEAPLVDGVPLGTVCELQ